MSLSPRLHSILTVHSTAGASPPPRLPYTGRGGGQAHAEHLRDESAGDTVGSIPSPRSRERARG